MQIDLVVRDLSEQSMKLQRNFLIVNIYLRSDVTMAISTIYDNTYYIYEPISVASERTMSTNIVRTEINSCE